MSNIKTAARIFYGLGIAGIGILHFMYAGFRPVILPLPPETTQGLSGLIYLFGSFLVVAGLSIVAGKWIKPFALLLSIVLLLFLLLGHLPNRLTNMPAVLGMWTDAIKLLALAGGALIVARVFPGNANPTFFEPIHKLSFLGRYFFGIMLLLFGIDHFLYADFVKTLVPLWIPGSLFWTYVGGIALIGAGLAFIISFKVKAISLLTGTMLLIWLIVLHIPRSIVADNSIDPNEIVSVFECFAFSGVAFLLWFDEPR